MKILWLSIILLLPLQFWAADNSGKGLKKKGKSNIETVYFQSQALGTQMKYAIYFPPNFKTNVQYPVLYMIHGYNCNENYFFEYLGMNRKADKLIRTGKIRPMLIVVPYVQNSYCLNSAEEPDMVIFNSNTLQGAHVGKYEDYIMKDLIGYIDSHYPVLTNRENRYIGGISMGGFASLHLAFKYPEMFGKVGGHSAAITADEELDDFWQWMYPNKQVRQERDPIEIAKTKDLGGLDIYLDCGKDDSLFPGAQGLAAVLKSRGIAVNYHEYSGAHFVSYWISHTDEYLNFYGGIPKK